MSRIYIKRCNDIISMISAILLATFGCLECKLFCARKGKWSGLENLFWLVDMPFQLLFIAAWYLIWFYFEWRFVLLVILSFSFLRNSLAHIKFITGVHFRYEFTILNTMILCILINLSRQELVKGYLHSNERKL